MIDETRLVRDCRRRPWARHRRRRPWARLLFQGAVVEGSAIARGADANRFVRDRLWAAGRLGATAGEGGFGAEPFNCRALE